MLNVKVRPAAARVVNPVARWLAGHGVSPDAITVVGTLGVMGGSLGFFPRGEWFWGTMVVTAFVFSDMLDGAVARITQRTGPWGAFLDSTLDRFGDAARLRRHRNLLRRSRPQPDALLRRLGLPGVRVASPPTSRRAPRGSGCGATSGSPSAPSG